MRKHIRIPGLIEPLKSIKCKDGLYNPTTRRHIDLIDFLKSLGIEKNSKILDVGCGSGLLVERLVRNGYSHLEGVDWKEADYLVPEARAVIKQYRQSNLNEDGLKHYPDNSFDVIICSDVLEHLETPAAMLREMARVVGPDGHIIITLPNAFNIFERVRWFVTGNSNRYRQEAEGEFGHISVLPLNPLKSLLTRAGLKLENIGQSACIQGGWLLFPHQKFGPMLSYNLPLHIRMNKEAASQRLLTQTKHLS